MITRYSSYPRRVTAALIVLTGWALWANLASFAFVSTPGHRDGITQYEQHLTPLKSLLPSQGMIGYVTNVPVRDIRFAGAATARYYLTQYALAPLIVEYSTAHQLLIGVTDPSRPDPQWWAGSWSLIYDGGHGIVLLKRPQP